MSRIVSLDYDKVNDEWIKYSAGFHYNSDERVEGFYTICAYYNRNSGFHIDSLDNSIAGLYYNDL